MTDRDFNDRYDALTEDEQPTNKPAATSKNTRPNQTSISKPNNLKPTITPPQHRQVNDSINHGKKDKQQNQ